MSGNTRYSIDRCSKRAKLSSIGNIKSAFTGLFRSRFCFVGDPIPEEEARERWRWRYELKSQRSNGQSWKLNADEEDEVILNIQFHYAKAKVSGRFYNLGDCVYIQGEEGQKYVGRIVEFFKTTDGEHYFRAQWFYRAEDTVLKQEAFSHDKRRLFYSTIMNDNSLDCIISKVIVVQKPPALGLRTMPLPPSEFYYDMEYCNEYSTFRSLQDNSLDKYQLEAFGAMLNCTSLKKMLIGEPLKDEFTLLDLYSGCGGMSTGLCLGAKLSRVNLVTKWAVDGNKSACDSLKMNHPESQVRCESTEDFLKLIEEWEKLCHHYAFSDSSRSESRLEVRSVDDKLPMDNKNSVGEFEVLRLLDICHGDPCDTGKTGLKFKVRWKGYSSDDDTWEPIEGLRNCEECLQEFVRSGFKSKILPLPGDVDVLCGGPPCQGISGYNRHRNTMSPLDDEKNRQIVVFMDIVKFLKPKYVLMENVCDILKLNKASLARYALSRLVHMNYQTRMGTLAAGCYGLPQFRLRVFFWGALPTEKLPQFPLPTHDVIVRYWPPSEFEKNTVAYSEGESRDIEKAVVLRDAIFDLPAVSSRETRDQMTYKKPPQSKFQKYIRLTKKEMTGSGKKDKTESMLYDHRTSPLSKNNYLRVIQIPHKKGANFRDLPGVVVGNNNVAYRDSTRNTIKLPSGVPLVPNNAFTFGKGKSKRPYGRLWWDETVSTVITSHNPQIQVVLHPEQDRTLTIRENARLQGFPDFYKFSGTIIESLNKARGVAREPLGQSSIRVRSKSNSSRARASSFKIRAELELRYRQVGNAVAVPVARALGYTLGMAIRRTGGESPVMKLPPEFAYQTKPRK